MDASQQLWVSDDLLEHLLSMLDLPTMVAFASVNPLAVSVLSRPTMWRRFFKRTYHMNMNTKSFQEEAKEVIKARQKAPMIADILKMMECQESRLLDFVEHISQAFPVDEDDEGRFPYGGEIKLSLGENSRTISPAGFMYLEYVVSHLDSNVVKVEEVTLADCAWDEKALFSHITRQQTEVKNFRITEGYFPSISDGLLSALAKSSSWSASSITMWNDDESTWRGLAEVSSKGEIEELSIRLDSGSVECSDFRCPETLTKVWQTTKACHLTLINYYVRKEDGKNGWARIDDYVRKEDGENGWARILELIARKEFELYPQPFFLP